VREITDAMGLPPRGEVNASFARGGITPYLKGKVFRKERAMGLFKYPIPSFPLLSLSGATKLRGMGKTVECGMWRIEI